MHGQKNIKQCCMLFSEKTAIVSLNIMLAFVMKTQFVLC
jgi:hypothetical protein